MKNNKYFFQAIALTLAIVIGIVVGGLLTNSRKNKELEKLVNKHKLELEKENKQAERKIIELAEVLKKNKLEATADSLAIVSLSSDITRNKKTIEELRRNALKLTPDEKVIYLTNRYN